MLDDRKLKQVFILIVGMFLIIGWFYPGKNQESRITNQESEEAEYLIISKLNIKVPIIYVDSKSEDKIQKGLLRGVVHVAGTARPGEIGNSYIVGHSSDYPQSSGEFKQIFARLPQLNIGDEIIIISTREELSFKIVSVKIVPADDLSVLNQETSGKRLLTLQTSYPIGTAQKRYVVIAEMTKK